MARKSEGFRKFVVLICVIAVSCCFLFAACGEVSPIGDDNSEPDTPPSYEEEYTGYIKQSEMPMLNITANAPIDSKYSYVNASYSMRSDSGEYDFDASGAIRLRGNYTMTLTKKPYRVKFDTKQSPIGMDSSRSWYLLNEATDFSLMRNYLALTYADSLMDYSLRARYTEVTVNGDYKGIYLMTDKRGEGKDRVPIVLTQDADTGWIVEVDNRAIGGDNSENKQPYEYCLREGVRFGVNAFHCNVPKTGLQAFVISEPDTPTHEQFVAIRQYVTDMIAALGNESYDRYMDVVSLAEFYIVEELWHDTDVGSVYFYREDGQSLVKMGPVWDFDLTCGISAIVSDVFGAQNVYNEWYYNQTNLFMKLVWNGKLFRSAFKRVWQEAYGSETADLIAGIDEVMEFLEKYQAKNAERWKVSAEARSLGKVVWSDEGGTTHESATSFMADRYKNLGSWYGHARDVKEFLTNRIEWMNDRIKYF